MVCSLAIANCFSHARLVGDPVVEHRKREVGVLCERQRRRKLGRRKHIGTHSFKGLPQIKCEQGLVLNNKATALSFF